KEKKSINSSFFSKLSNNNNKNNNKHPISAKSTLNKNTKKYNIGKIIQKPKNILKKNLSIENNNKKPKQAINKIQQKEKS
ncbi:MAG TPA: hypothetical protein DCL24_03295, partial [Erysipelotrichaceae bacterium]|nr:hypothetical protein [Erysipelotrichaceae bacterium]